MLDFSPTTARVSSVGATQIELEELYAKHQLMDAMRGDFVDDFSDELARVGIPVEFGLELLCQIALHKRANVETLVGCLKHHFKDEAEPAQACADMLFKACEEDVLDLNTIEDRFTGEISFQFTPLYDIHPDTQERIDRFQYPLPMVEEPRPVKCNRDTGYRTIPGSIILKKNHHDDDVCLDHINRMNSQRLRLNTDVVALMQNSWKNLDKRQDDETHEEYQARKKAFRKYDRTSRDVIDAMLLQADGFWLTHKFDKRGRTYSQGYHINPQGNDWNKACVEFAQAEPLNEE